MAKKYRTLEEAATTLRISADKLNEMRERGKVHGYRDGSSWKFTPDEIERVSLELSSAAESDLSSGEAGEREEDSLDEMIDVAELKLESDEDDDNESILVTEEELGRSDETTSSTIIGKSEAGRKAAEKDEAESDEVESLLAADDSDLKLAAEPGLDELADLEELTAGESDVLSGDSDVLPIQSDEPELEPVVAEADAEPTVKDRPQAVPAESEAADSDLAMADLGLDDGDDGGSSLKLGGDEELLLDDELSLDEAEGSPGESAEALSGPPEDAGEGEEEDIELNLDDDELVLGSGTGSDLALSDSGINLNHPSDSGISLEEVPADLGSGIDSGLGSGIDASLELDDAGMIELEEEVGEKAEAGPGDDDFLLTPVDAEGEAEEESDDSGSQVIALDADEFEPADEAVLTEEESPLVEEDAGFAAEEQAMVPAAQGAAAPVAATYSVWNIVSLSMVALLLACSGLLVMDLIRNIWSWDGAYTLNSTIMDGVLSMFGN
jgi:hypothetical protein